MQYVTDAECAATPEEVRQATKKALGLATPDVLEKTGARVCRNMYQIEKHKGGN